MPLEPSTSEWTPPPSLLDTAIVLPGILGAFLVAAAPLLWAGTHGTLAGYLVLYWGGIGAIAVGAVLAFFVGLFPLGTLSLGGILWIVVERVALAVGPPFGWAAVGLAAVGLILLPGAVQKVRAVTAARVEWGRTKGGSVEP
ncbi:MAG TPA: hypothetical protein VN864_08420 [Thermoplasmata archaeon]|nr:hypothetical protein [Thermoplasmata archaeon]